MISGIAKKLVDQIAVCAVDLDSVEAGGNGVARRAGIIGDEASNVVARRRPGLDVALLAVVGMGIDGGCGRRGRHRLVAAKIRMDQSSHMPKLSDDFSA